MIHLSRNAKVIDCTFPIPSNWQTLAQTHYENFPVASCLLAPRVRKPLKTLYAFARCADDIADEGELTPTERLAQLQQFRLQLQRPTHPLFIAIKKIKQQFALPENLFLDLLSAFEQDITKKRYQHFEEVLAYCRLSANPIGRLLLKLHHLEDPKLYQQSDDICTSLQLINFIQDLKSDLYERDRFYFPLSEVTPQTLSPQTMQFQLERAEHYLYRGAPLLHALSGRVRLEIKAICLGARLIIQKLKNRHSIFHRPTLSRFEKLTLLGQTFFKKDPLCAMHTPTVKQSF